MERRFFLQLLGLGSVASQVPLLSRQAEARTFEKAQGPHLVIGRGYYTGRLYLRKTWVQGVNAGIPGSMSFWKKDETSIQMTYEELDQVEVPNIPGLDMRSAQALQLYRQRTAEATQQLLEQARTVAHWENNPQDLQVVTLIRAPLKLVDYPQGSDTLDHAHVKIPSRVDHYIFQGKVHPSRVWSTSGELPLELNFGAESSEQLHAWFDEQTQAQIFESTLEPEGRSIPLVHSAEREALQKLWEPERPKS